MDRIGIAAGSGITRFTVIERDGCVLIEGALPAKWLGVIAEAQPKESILAPGLARMLGVSFAFGSEKDVLALIAKVGPDVERVVKQSTTGSGLSDAAVRWLATGERGISSNTIFTKLTGVDALDGWTQDYPHDPADFRRCRLLLEQCPELAEKFPTMAAASKKWASLVRDWDTICRTMDEEMPDWRTPPKRSAAPRTYELIKLSLSK